MDVKWEKQSSRIYTPTPILVSYLDEIEDAARACYDSTPKHGVENTAFIKSLIDREHESPIEFSQLHVIFRTSRGISHELVRHRLFSFCQESTRYVNYSKRGYISCILPDWADADMAAQLKADCIASANAYEELIKRGCTSQEARDILPQSTATTLHMCGNFRNWRHFFELRTTKAAHPEMRALANGLLNQLLKIDRLDVIFGEYANQGGTKLQYTNPERTVRWNFL